MVAHELHGGKAFDLITVQSPFEGVVDIVQRSVVAELGSPDGSLYGAVLTVVELAVDQVRDELVLCHFLFNGVFQRGFKSVVHTEQAHLAQFL